MKKLVLAAILAMSAVAHAQVEVSDVWVRATVPQQRATGVFMNLTAKQDARLVAAESPAADVVEVHEMKMEGEVMKMRAIDALPLPAGQAVALKPGGYHVMLIDLKAQIKEGDVVPVTLVIENAAGQQERIELQAPARPLATPAGGGAMQHRHGQR